MANGASYRYDGRTLSQALRDEGLPDFPLAAVHCAIAERKGANAAGIGHRADLPDPGHEFGTGSTTASDDETLVVLRRLLEMAPNDFDRRDWVKLALSLRIGFGEALRGAFVAFSVRYTGTPCPETEAQRVWDSAGDPHEVSSIAPALALLRDVVGEDAWRAVWKEEFAKRDEWRGDSTGDVDEGAGNQAWPEPASRFLQDELPAAPTLPVDEVFGPRLSGWMKSAAEAKNAPVDYVVLSVLSVLSATIGNARWVSPWHGWTEPPVIWTMCVGLPSSSKSPAFDAVLSPLRKVERRLREAAEVGRKEWAEKNEIAKLAEANWKEAVKAAIKEGKTPPARPREADAGLSPHVPRLVVNDTTIERLGALLANQPRGILQMRDELAGWLEGMQRYTSGSDRPFWLEAFGGRSFTVERMGREPVSVDRLTVSVMGGIQPDRLKSLLSKSDDDGLLARFLPIWPEAVPVHRPGVWADEALMEGVIEKLLTLDLVTDENDEVRPWFVHFTEGARELMDDFRRAVREWEGEAEGLMQSFIGKLPGLAARLSLVLALLDWAMEGGDDPHEITVNHFGRAAHLVEADLLPMARRAYADAAILKEERAAIRLVGIIREQGWRSFTSRDVMRLERSGLGTKAKLGPVLALLEDGECIRLIDTQSNPQGGRPQRLFAVNPALRGGSHHPVA